MERELSDAVKGAEQINDLMQSYFGKGDLKDNGHSRGPTVSDNP